jgi:hypothetical protein
MERFYTVVAAFGLLTLIGCSGTSPVAPSASARASSADAAGAQSAIAAPQAPIAHAEATDNARLVKASIEIDSNRHGSLTVRATRGLTLDVDLRSEGIVPGDFCHYNPECGPGTTFQLSGFWVGGSVSGTAEYHGDSYVINPQQQGACTITVRTAGSFVAPAQADTAVVTTPVTMSGAFHCYGNDVPALDLEAIGTATVSLQWSAAWASWRMTGAEFEFGAGN